MDRMLYIGMAGARNTLDAQAVVTNNLANASTTGFRADLVQARAMAVQGPGYASRVYAAAERPAVDLAPGPMSSTGNPLDLAIDGAGWFAVQAPDGGEAYTRAGDLRVSATGLLVTGAGHPLLGNNGPIAVPPADKLEIGADGTVTILPVGQPANALMVVDRIKLVNPPAGDLDKGVDGMMRLRDGGEAEAAAEVKVVSGTLEGSNVSAAEALVQMLALSRQYEMQVRIMQTADKNAEQGGRLLSMN